MSNNLQRELRRIFVNLDRSNYNWDIKINGDDRFLANSLAAFASYLFRGHLKVAPTQFNKTQRSTFSAGFLHLSDNHSGYLRNLDTNSVSISQSTFLVAPWPAINNGTESLRDGPSRGIKLRGNTLNNGVGQTGGHRFCLKSFNWWEDSLTKALYFILAENRIVRRAIRSNLLLSFGWN